MSHLTKEQLRDALVNHGIDPPSSKAKKDQLVEIYEDNIQGTLFSSDEETVGLSNKYLKRKSSQSSRKSESRTEGKIGNKTYQEALGSVVELDDEELFEQLKSFGVPVGPIVESTRTLYQKKLARLMAEDHGVMNGTDNGHESFVDNSSQVNSEKIISSKGTSKSPSAKKGLDKFSADEEDSNDEQPSPIVKKSPNIVKRMSETASSLRKRLSNSNLNDSSFTRLTPTPRRSIHSYKVTETAKHTQITEKDGKMTLNYSYERKTEEDDNKKSNNRLIGRKIFAGLPYIFILLLLVAVLFYAWKSEAISSFLQTYLLKTAERNPLTSDAPPQREPLDEPPSVSDV